MKFNICNIFLECRLLYLLVLDTVHILDRREKKISTENRKKQFNSAVKCERIERNTIEDGKGDKQEGDKWT